jgi:hypothetical protein
MPFLNINRKKAITIICGKNSLLLEFTKIRFKIHKTKAIYIKYVSFWYLLFLKNLIKFSVLKLGLKINIINNDGKITIEIIKAIKSCTSMFLLLFL